MMLMLASNEGNDVGTSVGRDEGWWKQHCGKSDDGWSGSDEGSDNDSK